MPRPKLIRQVSFQPRSDRFKPGGIPARELEWIELAIEEVEALRLSDIENLDQAACAEQMQVSRPTFARVLQAARQKVADALVNGKALRISGGVFELAVRAFACRCGGRWNVPHGGGPPAKCPTCGSDQFHRVDHSQDHGRGRGRGRRRRGGV